MAEECIMCQIISGDLRTHILYEDDLVVAFDIPKDHPEKSAPVHFLVVPREHIVSAALAKAGHEAMLGRLVTAAASIAREQGIEESGYRLLTNTGPDANQTVFHMHLHCLGGAKLGREG
jgi:histidine triad (HIT) family protein